MNLRDLIFYKKSDFTKKFDVDFQTAISKVETGFFRRKHFDYNNGKRKVRFKVNIKYGNVLQVEFYNHQGFSPSFQGKLSNENNKLKIEGKILLPLISILLILIWFFVILILTIKWLSDGSSLEDGEYLPFFLITGFLLLVYYKYQIDRDTKLLIEFIKSQFNSPNPSNPVASNSE